ncbi:NAD-dependent epimerase/dehydratase family protein [Paenibacillus sacheonensis]|uniref:NAD-dependent epimerase/dehydratase family protein n=1 Tax=Paenibacillus sacheonensis TaxID=742054 RepID=A0A7X4YPY4_9BACL|nr:NAD(P)-dependent oxidoreductase [Paenibacillus sacheonensis]MBM7566117.1 nucleoside-diphosphate-sugar epimerase [Paenibacillus sacheonensis]NBC70330.1 NAD-dependent epimerase/dehydratase family protein [Paenibacillus sacheonensis]
MKIAVAGASGVVGRALVPLLVENGHEVVGLIRNPAHAADLTGKGAHYRIVDVFDRDELFEALREIRPEAVIHQLTALGARNFADNARIRKEGTRNLVDASLAAGVRRIVAQSISWAYAPGEGPASEEEPLDLEAQAPRIATIHGVAALEQAAADMPEAVILRYGLLYGAGTWYAADGLMADLVRARKLPATDGISSFVHVEDAARAAALALAWPPGAYNIADREPAAGTEWLPAFAAAVGAPTPAVERGSARGERGARNDKALRQGWEPRYGSWREGFRASPGMTAKPSME